MGQLQNVHCFLNSPLELGTQLLRGFEGEKPPPTKFFPKNITRCRVHGLLLPFLLLQPINVRCIFPDRLVLVTSHGTGKDNKDDCFHGVDNQNDEFGGGGFTNLGRVILRPRPSSKLTRTKLPVRAFIQSIAENDCHPNGAQARVKHKQQKIFLRKQAHNIIDPWAIMVHFKHRHADFAAIVARRRLYHQPSANKLSPNVQIFFDILLGAQGQISHVRGRYHMFWDTPGRRELTNGM